MFPNNKMSFSEEVLRVFSNARSTCSSVPTTYLAFLLKQKKQPLYLQIKQELMSLQTKYLCPNLIFLGHLTQKKTSPQELIIIYSSHRTQGKHSSMTLLTETYLQAHSNEECSECCTEQILLIDCSLPFIASFPSGTLPPPPPLWLLSTKASPQDQCAIEEAASAGLKVANKGAKITLYFLNERCCLNHQPEYYQEVGFLKLMVVRTLLVGSQTYIPLISISKNLVPKMTEPTNQTKIHF